MSGFEQLGHGELELPEHASVDGIEDLDQGMSVGRVSARGDGDRLFPRGREGLPNRRDPERISLDLDHDDGAGASGTGSEVIAEPSANPASG